MGVEFFHALGWTEGRTERRTGMTELIVAYRNFANAPKMDIKTLSEAGRVLFGVQSKKRRRKVQAKRQLYFSLHFSGEKIIKSTIKCNSHALFDNSYT